VKIASVPSGTLNNFTRVKISRTDKQTDIFSTDKAIFSDLKTPASSGPPEQRILLLRYQFSTLKIFSYNFGAKFTLPDFFLTASFLEKSSPSLSIINPVAAYSSIASCFKQPCNFPALNSNLI
jgi:hypothetical protein